MDDFSRRRKERHQKKKPDHLPIIFNEGDIFHVYMHARL